MHLTSSIIWMKNQTFFEELQKSLDKLKIDYKINRFLVRGLDYYNHTAFEYITNDKKESKYSSSWRAI